MSSTDVIAEFRKTVTPDLYDASKYIDWGEINDRLATFGPAIEWLGRNRTALSPQTLAEGLRDQPNLYEISMILLGVPRGAGFSDGRELPDSATPLRTGFAEIAGLLIDIGFRNILADSADVVGMVRVGLTAQDALRRRYRVGSTIEDRILVIVDKAILSANATGPYVFARSAARDLPTIENRKFDHVISIDGTPRVIIDSVFQTASGGRQLRDLSVRFPELQEAVVPLGISLILIADGRGLKEARDDVLSSLFARVTSCLTLRQAASGGLARDLLRIASRQVSPPSARSVSVIIETALATSDEVMASDLPVGEDEARLALADYLERNSELDLMLGPRGRSLAWRRANLVNAGRELRRDFNGQRALNFFHRVMDAEPKQHGPENEMLCCSLLELKMLNPVVPKRFLVAAVSEPPSTAVLRSVSTIALGAAPDSKMAIVLSPQSADEDTATGWRRLQRTMATNVIVLGTEQLLEFATSSQPATALLATHLLRQSDLVKSSPFVLNSVTPQRMFYGREVEEAAMLSTLKTNSIALVGGRRIGKTSLMRHVEERLEEAGFVTFFGDCQTVRDWDSFAEMAERWGVEVPRPFQPSQLIALIQKLNPNRQRKLVLLLDEIDQLLDWDRKHAEDEVPEAFFRACRTLSQEANAQFVFSGERVIASRLWDAQSPHWNFAKSLDLRQLDRAAARKLLLSPLEALQISISEEETFFEIAWSRTNGHPQLLQTLGDKLVRALNDRPASLRADVSPTDLTDVADTYQYAEHYIETYWGQSTPTERLITLLIANGINTLSSVHDFLKSKEIRSRAENEIRSALRMLHVYGIIDSTQTGYDLTLDWFRTAISFYGTVDELTAQYVAKAR